MAVARLAPGETDEEPDEAVVAEDRRRVGRGVGHSVSAQRRHDSVYVSVEILDAVSQHRRRLPACGQPAWATGGETMVAAVNSDTRLGSPP
jgi:hypothetical protein